jgi:hypothetical protein
MTWRRENSWLCRDSNSRLLKRSGIVLKYSITYNCMEQCWSRDSDILSWARRIHYTSSYSVRLRPINYIIPFMPKSYKLSSLFRIFNWNSACITISCKCVLFPIQLITVHLITLMMFGEVSKFLTKLLIKHFSLSFSCFLCLGSKFNDADRSSALFKSLVHNELAVVWKEATMAELGIWLEGLKRRTKDLSENSRRLGRDSSR